MNIPPDWISETRLRYETQVCDEDREMFHRNLINWRHRYLLPRTYDGFPVPVPDPLGFGVGNEAYYPPIVIQMVRRINELRPRGTIDQWLWQLWIEGFPIDIVGWCRKRLAGGADALSEASETKLIDCATRNPKRTDGRRTFFRRVTVKGWYSLMTWAVRIAVGARLSESVFNPNSPVSSALAKVLDDEADPSIVHVGLAESQIEKMSVSSLLLVLDGDIGAGELHKAREDCFVLSHADNVPTIPGKVLAAMWGRVSCRAVLLPALIILHRSPDHRMSLLDWVKQHSDSPALLQFEIPHARR